MIINVKFLWFFAFIQMLYVRLSEAFEINTGLKFACSDLKLECSKEERIWVRRAILIFSSTISTNHKTPSTSSQISSSQPTSSPSKCSINFALLSLYPHCDITEAVVQRCSHSLYCQVSLQTFASFCSHTPRWKEVGVVVDNFICLPSKIAWVVVGNEE